MQLAKPEIPPTKQQHRRRNQKVTKRKDLAEQAQNLITKYGQNGFQTAKTTILHGKGMPESVREVLRYFIEETWRNTHHPALISLACEAVGGKPDDTIQISAAIVLLTGAADIHDDIIDKSKMKGSKPTALGKFGQDLILLTGDALLFRGLMLFHDACEEFPKRKRQELMCTMDEAFLKIGNAMTNERRFKGKLDFRPEEYREAIEPKGAISEACARIGAVIGGGTPREIDMLSHFGRTLGFLMTIRNEFADMFYPGELRHRAQNETLPLPLLYALQDKTVGKEILHLLKSRLTNCNAERIAELVMKTKQIQDFTTEVKSIARNEEEPLKAIRGNTDPLKLLLRFSTENP